MTAVEPRAGARVQTTTPCRVLARSIVGLLLVLACGFAWESASYAARIFVPECGLSYEVVDHIPDGGTNAMPSPPPGADEWGYAYLDPDAGADSAVCASIDYAYDADPPPSGKVPVGYGYNATYDAAGGAVDVASLPYLAEAEQPPLSGPVPTDCAYEITASKAYVIDCDNALPTGYFLEIDITWGDPPHAQYLYAGDQATLDVAGTGATCTQSAGRYECIVIYGDDGVPDDDINGSNVYLYQDSDWNDATYAEPTATYGFAAGGSSGEPSSAALELVANASDDLGATLLAIAYDVLPYALGVLALALSWPYAKRFVKG